MTVAAYPAYSEYKDSGEGWLEDVPSHWKSRKLKQLFTEKKHRPNLSLNCGSISFGKVVEKDDERVPLSTKASYQEVLAGEYLVNPLNLNYDLKSLRIGLSDINVVVSAGYIVLQAKDELNKQYFNYLLHRYDVSYMKLLGSGVRQTISFNHIANSILVAPPLEEQRAIASFLDDKCEKIDEAVRIKEAQIALLRERRQILIQEAVTRGLNPDAPMKDSGIDWIGQIPVHWERHKIRHLFDIGRGRVIPKEELVEFGEYPVFSSQTKNDGVFGYLNTYDFNVDQLTWTTDGANAGTVFHRKGKHNCTNVCGTLKPKTTITNLEFCVYAVGHAAQFYKRPDTNGAKIMNEEMAAIEVPMPPIAEQVRVAAEIDAQFLKFDNAITLKQSQITALKEYKTSLINAAVTGKIKVI